MPAVQHNPNKPTIYSKQWSQSFSTLLWILIIPYFKGILFIGKIVIKNLNAQQLRNVFRNSDGTYVNEYTFKDH